MESLQELLSRAWAQFCVFLGYPPPGEEDREGSTPPATPDWPPAPSLYTSQEPSVAAPETRRPQPLSEILADEIQPAGAAEPPSAVAQEPLPFEIAPPPALEPEPDLPAPIEDIGGREQVEEAALEPAPSEQELPAPTTQEPVELLVPAWPAVEVEPPLVETLVPPPDEAEVAAPPSPPSRAPRERPYRYEVRSGETLSSIAKRFGVTVWALVEANDLPDANRIYAGQKLTIPGYVPMDTAATRPEPVQDLASDLGDTFRYAIEPDDTLSSIAKRFGVTMRDLIEANDLADMRDLQVGRWLVIPGVKAPPAEPEPEPVHEEMAAPVTIPPLAGPATVRGLYLSYDAAGQSAFREYIFELLATTELNALVVDVKGDFGWLTYPTQVPLAVEIGANQPSAPDLSQLLAEAKAQGVYPIARLVTFKDNLLAQARPEWAVKTLDGGELWRDRANQGWVDPFLEEVWNYVLQIAEEAARLGFAEILFDFLRFPIHGPQGRPQFSQEATRAARVGALTSFLGAARSRLEPLGVRISANVFGYACWRSDDALVGHDLERLSAYLDLICPTLYPSTFSSGIPGCEVAVECPYEIVYDSALRAVERVTANDCLVRPWLQDFPDYRFDRRTFTAQEIREQISAALDAGCAGFLVWDPRVKYTPEAYQELESLTTL
jgi:LysM repeat protein